MSPIIPALLYACERGAHHVCERQIRRSGLYIACSCPCHLAVRAPAPAPRARAWTQRRSWRQSRQGVTLAAELAAEGRVRDRKPLLRALVTDALLTLDRLPRGGRRDALECLCAALEMGLRDPQSEDVRAEDAESFRAAHGIGRWTATA